MTQQERQLIRDEGTAGLLLVAVVFVTGIAVLGCLTPINLQLPDVGRAAETMRLD